ncbi:MAG: hypothetical protein MUO34_03690 [Ignavibacteriaceae bacterium]|nr:hypothetical protein [Ignavibacteriaceae bacterium]
MGGSEGLTVYDVNKSIETAKVMSSRRKVKFNQDDENLFREIFNLTKYDSDKKGF